MPRDVWRRLLSRKMNLVGYGFRLPAALDNRPLKFEEFRRLTPPGALRQRILQPTIGWKCGRRGSGTDHPPHRSARPP